jgi:hypothetical protein
VGAGGAQGLIIRKKRVEDRIPDLIEALAVRRCILTHDIEEPKPPEQRRWIITREHQRLTTEPT